MSQRLLQQRGGGRESAAAAFAATDSEAALLATSTPAAAAAAAATEAASFGLELISVIDTLVCVLLAHLVFVCVFCRSDLDSLADVISFAVAPAVLGFTLGLRGIWDCLILVFFVCCGVSRLARYNVTAETLAGRQTQQALTPGARKPRRETVFLTPTLAVASSLVCVQMFPER